MRKISYFPNARFTKGSLLTRELYNEVANNSALLQLCNEIAAEPDKGKRAELKKQLPVITWQAFFEGKRLAKEAHPSGLFMLDIDHVDNPFELYSKQVASRVRELGIVYVGKTASTHGLRIVAKCLPTLHTLEECQKWLASNLKVEYDGVCKDFARCSYLVHDSYTYFMDAKEIWADPEEGTVYAGGKNPVQVNAEMGKMLNDTAPQMSQKQEGTATGATSSSPTGGQPADQTEGLFGGPKDYKGVPYATICKEWLGYTGGEPEEGSRNMRLFKLALRMRYITDFNEATMLRVMPSYGLPQEEMRTLIHSACGRTRAADMPKDLQEVLERIDKRIKLGDNVEEDLELPEVITDSSVLPPLPPVFREMADIAPDDFKTAVTLSQLPILGALGSRLRAQYLDGKIHSPSFQVSLEAPQASGKSFLAFLVETELAQMMEGDQAQREKEKAYTEKVAEMKMLNIKVNADNKDQILGQKPKGIVRYVPATISITKMLMRMEAAQGLHLFAFSPEVDTVLKAFKRGFSSLSDALRLAFDNDLYGQDYASENSYSGNVRLYYNTLYSGTPKAMRRFYPDVEDGLVSRVLFITLPDQFGKPMPVWGKLNADQQRTVDIGLARLSEISLQGEEVMPEHLMKMGWLNKGMDAWVKAQQAEAVKTDDRTRDIFCRRSAVVGFRAGMLAWFLYGEIPTPPIRRKVVRFATWVANSMLNQHLLRFDVKTTYSNVNHWEEAYKALRDEFSREDLEKALVASGSETPIKQVLYKWKLLGIIEQLDEGRRGQRNRKQGTTFKKIKK